jgi:hypothetical protein
MTRNALLPLPKGEPGGEPDSVASGAGLMPVTPWEEIWRSPDGVDPAGWFARQGAGGGALPPPASPPAPPPAPARLSRAAVLDRARDAVLRDRAVTHGAPEDLFAVIAGLWSVRLGVAVSPAQVCILLADLKGARAWGNPGHADNWVDLAGYAACGGELSGAMADG